MKKEERVLEVNEDTYMGGRGWYITDAKSPVTPYMAKDETFHQAVIDNDFFYETRYEAELAVKKFYDKDEKKTNEYGIPLDAAASGFYMDDDWDGA